MASTTPLDRIHLLTSLATLGALVFIAVQLVSLRNAQPEPYRPLTLGDFKAAAKDPQALRDLENRLPVANVSGTVNVVGTVDVDTVFNAVSVQPKGLEFPVRVTNQELSTEVTNLPRTLPVEVTNFYEMPRR